MKTRIIKPINIIPIRMSAEDKYHEIAALLTPHHIDLLRSYYRKWEGQDVIPLKFRFIKIFAKNLDEDITKWYLLHHLVNKRRIENKDLPIIINQIIDNNIIPLRIFHSVTEWLAPNEVWSNKHHHPRIIRSGFIPFENDDSLEQSIAAARELKEKSDCDCIFVFSGNKSIHSWYDLDITIDDPTIIAHAEKRERYEVELRRKIFKQAQKMTSFDLDHRISADTRRVVPIIGTVNAMTGRRVITIDPDRIGTITKEELLLSTQLDDWKEILLTEN